MAEHLITLQLHALDILGKKLLDRRDELVFQGYEHLSLSEVARIVILEGMMIERQYWQVGKGCQCTTNRQEDVRF